MKGTGIEQPAISSSSSSSHSSVGGGVGQSNVSTYPGSMPNQMSTTPAVSKSLIDHKTQASNSISMANKERFNQNSNHLTHDEQNLMKNFLPFNGGDFNNFNRHF